MQGHFRLFLRDERRGRRLDLYVVSDKQPTEGMKGRFCEYHQSKTHDTVNCSVLKREIEEKQFKGNLIEVARSLQAKFDAKNAKDATRERNQP